MRNNYALIIFLSSFFSTFSSFGQTTTIDFETENSGYTPSAVEGSTFIDVFNRISSTVGTNTSSIWAVEDTSLTNPSITLDAINISGATGFTFSIDMIAHHFNDWDNSDELLITYSLDGGSSQNLMWVQNTGEQFNDPAALDTNFDGNGECANVLPAITTGTGTDGCTVTANDFQTFTTSTISTGGASSLVITLQFNGFTSTDEGLYLDNIVINQITGNVAPAVNNISISPVNPTSSDMVAVSADFTDADGIASATLRWGTTSGSLTNTVSMSNTSGDTYSGTIPDQADGTTVYYTVEATDSNAAPETTVSSENNYNVVNPIAATIPYNVDFTNNDPFLNSWTEQNIVGPTIGWTYSSGLGAQMNAFSESCNAQDWLISPAFNLDTTTEEFLSVDLTQRFGSQSLELLYSTDYSGTGDPNLASWTSLQSIAAQSSSGTVATIDVDNVSLNSISGTSVYFAFRYTSAASGCSDWRVANLSIQSGFVWTGTTDNDWATSTNWLTGSVPGASADVIIPSGLTNYPTISSAVSVNSMNIASGATLIANAAVTGNATYTRSLGTTNWYLVSSPVSGEDMTDMRANNNFKTNGSSEISFAPYDNSQAVANDRWAYFSNTATDALVNGKGYSASLSAAGNISFTGSVNSSDVIIALTQGGASGTDFNLLGNPYTAFVNSATFLTAESGDLASETIWLWNQATSSYETKVTADAFKIAPGQGFFVEANSTNNVSFTGAMQSHEASDTFQRSSRPEVQLYVNDGSNSRYAKLYYINGTTTGFDNGYDGKLFNGLTNSFAVYTHLLSDSQGDNYQVQSLPNSDIETMVVPVGLIAESNKEITFSVNTKNLPQGVNVYLEDRVNNTFVNLSEGDHTITTKSAVNGIGQYYIHANSAKLSNSDISQNIDNVSIYKSSKNEITVAGLQAQANVKVFSLLGEELINTDINSYGVSKVALPNLSTGVYVVKLNSVLGNITKKIILE